MFSQDPPSRVARLNYLSGNVSMEPAGVDDWAPADLNRPFTIGDYLYTDQGAQAELHLDDAVLRMGAQTSFGFLNLDDRTVQLKLTEGDMYIRLHNFGYDQVFEVDTPNAAITLLGNGIYRFRIDAGGNLSFVVVRQGQAQITGGGQAFTLGAGNSVALTGTDQLAYDVEIAPQPDDFDTWCQARDAHEAHLASARYLPPTVIGYEDLDDYGAWQDGGSDYGPVWYPRTVAAGWAPYQAGHWTWIEPWGWSWVDDMPWGFAPFHYGRWAYIGNRWGWAPGPIVVGGFGGPAIRPYYAPAMVAWFGGAHWGIALSGGGPSLGWVPLGFGEVYTPSYACSRNYFNNVNVYNTRIVRNVNITNVYNTVYVNKQVYNQQFVNVRAPNAVMTMQQSAFASGRPVRQGGYVVRQADLGRVQGGTVLAPPVAPTRQALMPSLGRPAARPPAQVANRQIIARSQPPSAPASFAARQQFLQQTSGQVHNVQFMRQAAAPVAVANIKQVGQTARPVQVQAGARVGNVSASNQRNGFPQPARPTQAAVPATQQVRPAVQSGYPGQRVNQQSSAPPERPVPAAVAGHGTPPNMRQSQAQAASQVSQPVYQPTRPSVQPATPANPPARQEVQPQRPAVQPERSEPAVTQPRPVPQERSAPTAGASRETSPNVAQPQQPKVQDRPKPGSRPIEPVKEESRPTPEARPAPENRPESAEHGTPPAHNEQRPAPPSKKEQPKDNHPQDR